MTSQLLLASQKRPNSKQSIPFDLKPLWSHVTILEVPKQGGNRKWQCNYCNKIVNGSYTKVKGHLLKLPNHNFEACSVISNEILDVLMKEHTSAETRKTNEKDEATRRAGYVTLPPGYDLVQPKRRKTIAGSFNMMERDDVDKEIARLFYAASLPFSLVKHPQFKAVVQKLAKYNLAGYVPLTYNRLRTTLLAQEKAHINHLMQPI